MRATNGKVPPQLATAKVPPRLLATIPEVCAFTGLSRPTVRKMIRVGVLEGVQNEQGGRVYHVTVPSLAHYLRVSIQSVIAILAKVDGPATLR